MEGRLVQLDFLAVFDSVSCYGLVNKLKSTGVGRPFLFIVSQFISDSEAVRTFGW